jgi:hypothetical protein
MKPMRQVECVELMIAANTVTIRYAEALLVATPPTALLEAKKPKKMVRQKKVWVDGGSGSLPSA